jgi:hypothetical protein
LERWGLLSGRFLSVVLQCFIRLFILDLLLLTLCTVICPDPGVERICMYTKITGRLGNGLIRLDSRLNCPFLKMQWDIFSSWVGSSNTPRMGREVLIPVCPVEYRHISSFFCGQQPDLTWLR